MTPEPVILTAGASSAAIYPEHGGRLGQLDFGAGPLLRGPSDELDWGYWGSYPLLPWSNRIPGGHLVFGDIDAHLPVNFEDGSALHGLTAAIAWDVLDSGDNSVDLEVDVVEGPYVVRGRQRFELTDGLLDLELSVVNRGAHPVPVGLGIHPWFRFGPVRVPADAYWPGHGLPTGEPPVPVSGDTDLRSLTVPPLMDRGYTQLTGDTADAPAVELRWRGAITQVVVYTGEPGFVCVEPVTMASDGFGLAERGVAGHGVHILEPAATFSVGYQFVRPG